MARRNLIRCNNFPYHVTIRCNNREWFSINLDKVWKMSLDALKDANDRVSISLHAFVLMNNHYHLFLTTPNSNLDKFMYEFNSRLSKKIRGETGRINRIFGDRYKWSVIYDSKYYATVLRYVYQNPLKANIVSRCEYYLYSTLFYIFNKKRFPIHIHSDFFEKVDELIVFVNNEAEASETSGSIRKALHHTVFNITSRKPKRMGCQEAK